MPYNRKKYRRFKKRFRRAFKRYGRFRRGSRMKITRSRFRGIVMPDKMMVKLPFYTRRTLQISAGDANIQVNRGNGPFDPDQTGTGGQPLGYDEWANFYAKQRVYASKISVSYQAYTADAVAFVGLIPSVDVYTAATVVSRQVIEQPYCQWRFLSPLGGSKDQVHLKGYMTTAKMFGDRNAAKDDNAASVIGANPASQWYWNIFIATQLATDTLTVEVILKQVFYIQFYNRVALVPS